MFYVFSRFSFFFCTQSSHNLLTTYYPKWEKTGNVGFLFFPGGGLLVIAIFCVQVPIVSSHGVVQYIDGNTYSLFAVSVKANSNRFWQPGSRFGNVLTTNTCRHQGAEYTYRFLDIHVVFASHWFLLFLTDGWFIIMEH